MLGRKSSADSGKRLREFAVMNEGLLCLLYYAGSSSKKKLTGRPPKRLSHGLPKIEALDLSTTPI